MPGMDGIETAQIIRGLGYTKPIVALTANVITGQAEMFFENGFDDFISKPIDIRQLDIVLNKLIRDKYPDEIIEAARRTKNKVRTSPDSPPSLSPEIAKVFIRDTEKAVGILETILEKQGNYGDKDIKLYIINVHAMKSALANIGESELSAFALKLEEAGRERNITVISKETPAFISALRAVIEKINPNKSEDDVKDDIRDEDRTYLLEKLSLIRKSCEDYNKKTAKETLANLQQKKWPRPVREMLEAIAEHLLHSDFTEAAKLAKDYTDSQTI